MRSGNPSLRGSAFGQQSGVGSPAKSMSMDGTVRRTLLLLLVTFIGFVFSWNSYLGGGDILIYTLVGSLGGFIVALITIFKPHMSPFTSPVYALLEGVFLGAISAQYAGLYDGIVLQAVLLTFGVFVSMLILYALRIIKPTKKFRTGILIATGSIAFVYIINFVLSLFGMSVPFLHDSGPIGIVISIVIVGVAALNLILDFNFIEEGSNANLPKYMEWYGAFGLMVTLVWLYLEILRLLAKLNRRD